MTQKITLSILALLLTGACADISALDGVASARAVAGPYPKLVPMGDLVATANSGSLTDATAQELAARIAALKRRAARLRATDI